MKFILIVLILLTSIYGEPASKDDIRLLIGQMDKRFTAMQDSMDKRFTAMQDSMDKRFEQVDKRFDVVDKRFENVFNLMYILMGLVFASPFIAVYLKDKREADYQKHVDTLRAVVFALKRMAKNDKELSESLHSVNI